MTHGAWWYATNLRHGDMFAGNTDGFPGQRQLLHDCGEHLSAARRNPMLGVYALQRDWYTTYYGGFGSVSYSSGLAAAQRAGGNLTIGKLNEYGLAPSVEVAIAVGNHAILQTGSRPPLPA